MPKKMKIAPKLTEYFRPKHFDRSGFTDEEWQHVLDCRRELKAVIRVCEAVDSWSQYDGDSDGITDPKEENDLQYDMVLAINKLNDLTGRKR